MDGDDRTASFAVSLVPEISLVEDGAEFITLVFEHGRVPLRATSVGLRSALRGLGRGGRTYDQLAGEVLRNDGLGELTLFSHYFNECARRCLIRRTVMFGGTRYVSLVPMVPDSRARFAPIEPDRTYRLSRFAYARREGRELVLETPTSTSFVTVHDERAGAVFSALALARTANQLVTLVPVCPREAIADILSMFVAAGLVCEEVDGGFEEDSNTALAQWEFHDLVFHARSRMGRHNKPFGATFRFVGKVKPQPLAKTSDAAAIELPKPVSPALDVPMSLAEAVEKRCSVREYGASPITFQQLGEFLYLVARMGPKADFEIRNDDGALVETFEIGSRPYPSGGAIYELELYVTVDKCAGLDSGLYWYNSNTHRLVRIAERGPGMTRLLSDASLSAAIDHFPQVLITLASRFERMSWKYNALAYAATLKNVGVLYELMYLVATAMRLAPCALGSGNSVAFSEAIGSDYYAESSVGEFMLGSLPDAETTELKAPFSAAERFARTDRR